MAAPQARPTAVPVKAPTLRARNERFSLAAKGPVGDGGFGGEPSVTLSVASLRLMVEAGGFVTEGAAPAGRLMVRAEPPLKVEMVISELPFLIVSP
jgi:hypothetical protein